MNFALKPIALAILIAAVQLAGVADAQVPTGARRTGRPECGRACDSSDQGADPDQGAGRLDRLRRHHVYAGGR